MKPEIIPENVKAGREHIAELARADGENIFANEVLAGAWDHRNDVRKAIDGARFKGLGFRG